MKTLLKKRQIILFNWHFWYTLVHIHCAPRTVIYQNKTMVSDALAIFLKMFNATQLKQHLPNNENMSIVDHLFN